MKKLTPKQRVLKRYPSAFCCRVLLHNEYVVWDNQDSSCQRLGRALSANSAWAAAARRLRKSRP